MPSEMNQCRDLQVNPSVPSNALKPSEHLNHTHDSGRTPDGLLNTATKVVTWEQVERELWISPEDDKKPDTYQEIHEIEQDGNLDSIFILWKRLYWMNYFFSTIGHCDRIRLRKDIDFPKKSIGDLYSLVFEKRALLAENGRCNLMSHRIDFFEKILNDGTYRDFLNKTCWIGLLLETNINFRGKVFSLAAKSSLCLSFILEHVDITTDELNTLLKNADYEDFRLGKIHRKVTAEDWINFLNSQTEMTRLAFLQSNHPFNDFSWLQIPRLDNFTVADAKTILEMKGRPVVMPPTHTHTQMLRVEDIDGDDDAPAPVELSDSVVVSSDLLARPLGQYIAEQDIEFSVADFLKMRGKEIATDDFLRVTCDYYSFTNFTSFLQPFSQQNDFSKVNGVLACFFSCIMKNPGELLHAVDFPSDKSNNLMEIIYASSPAFAEVVRCARFAKEGSASNAQAQLSNPEAAVVTLEGDRWYYISNDFVITNDGSASASAVPSENYDALIDSAQLSLRSGNIISAAREYCIALTLKQDPKIIAEAYRLIHNNKLTALYGVLGQRIETYSGNLFAHINGISTSIEDKISLFNEIYLLICTLKTIKSEQIKPIYTRFYDNIYRFIDQIINAQSSGNGEFKSRCQKARAPLLKILMNMAEISSASSKVLSYIHCVKLSNSDENKAFVANMLIALHIEKYNFSGMEIERVLLESFVSSPQEMLSLVDSWFNFNKVKAEFKEFLLALPINESTLEKVAQKINDFSVFLEDNDKKAQYLDEMHHLFTKIYIKKIDLENLSLAQTIYQKKSASGTECADFYNKLIGRWMNKTKHVAVCFVLSGSEERFCDTLQNRPEHAVLLDSLSTAEIQITYRESLVRMIAERNVAAVNQLGDLGIQINLCDENGEPLVLKLLMKEDSTLFRYDRSIEKVVSRISPEIANKIFRAFIQHNTSANQYIDINLKNLYLAILARCDNQCKRTRLNDLLYTCFSKRDMSIILLLLDERNSAVYQPYLMDFIDQNWVSGELRNATVRGQSENIQRLLELSTKLPTITPILKFSLSGEESKLYTILKEKRPRTPPVSQGLNEKYTWLISQMVHEKNVRALNRLVAMKVNIDLRGNDGQSLLLPLFRLFWHESQHDDLKLLLSALTGNSRNKIFTEMLADRTIAINAITFFVVETFSTSPNKQKDFNKLVTRIKSEMQFASEGIRLQTLSTLEELILQPEFKTKADADGIESLKRVLLLLLCARNSNHVGLLANTLLRHLGGSPVIESADRLKVSVYLFGKAYNEESYFSYKFYSHKSDEENLRTVFDAAIIKKDEPAKRVLRALGWMQENNTVTRDAPIDYVVSKTM